MWHHSFWDLDIIHTVGMDIEMIVMAIITTIITEILVHLLGTQVVIIVHALVVVRALAHVQGEEEQDVVKKIFMELI